MSNDKEKLTDEEILSLIPKEKYKVTEKELESKFKELNKNPNLDKEKYEMLNYTYDKIINHIEEVKDSKDPKVDKLHAIFLADLIKETMQFHDREARAFAVKSLILSGRIISSYANEYFREKRKEEAINEYRTKNPNK